MPGGFQVCVAVSCVGFQVIALRPFVPRLYEQQSLFLRVVLQAHRRLLEPSPVVIRRFPAKNHATSSATGGVVPV